MGDARLELVEGNGATWERIRNGDYEGSRIDLVFVRDAITEKAHWTKLTSGHWAIWQEFE